jgi:hypothetical protein
LQRPNPTRLFLTALRAGGLAAIASSLASSGCGGSGETVAPGVSAGAGGDAAAGAANAAASGGSAGVGGAATAEPGLGGAGLGGSGGGAVALPESQPDCDASSANAAGYCWRAVTIGGGGFVSGIVASDQVPSLIYARTDVGGAYRWSPDDARWLPLQDWLSEDEVGLLGVESLALDPSAPNRLYLLAGINYFNGGKTALLSSEDFGATFTVHDVTAQFTAHGNGMGRQSGERLAVDPADGSILFTGTRQHGLFRSVDRGTSFERVTALDVTTTPNGNGISFVLFDPSSGDAAGPTEHIIVGVSRSGADNLFESLDAGATFAPVPGHPTRYVPQRAALSGNGMLYVTYANGAGPFPSDTDPMDRGELWKLELASGTWTEVSPLRGELSRGMSGISIDPSNPSRLLASTINTYQQQPWGYGDRLFLSLDAGTTWSDLIGEGRVVMANGGKPWIEQNAIHWAGSVVIDPFAPERALVTSGNGVFMTNELGTATSTWTFAVEGLEEMVPLGAASVPGAPLRSVVGDYDGFVHDDPDVSPAAGRFNPSMGTTYGLAVAALAPERVARVGNELYVSADGAQTWTQVTRPSEATGGQLAFSADGATLLWSVADTTFRSADQGATWSSVTGLLAPVFPEADAVSSSRFYAYDPSSGSLKVSNDGGVSFDTTTPLPAGGAARIRAVPGVEGELWVALNDGGLTRSVDAGNIFEPVASVQSCRAVGFGAARSAGEFPAVYIWGAAGGGPRGLYRSDDAGETFVRINDDAHEYGGPGNGELVIGDANVYGRVYMSSAGRGLIMGDLVRSTDATTGDGGQSTQAAPIPN